MSTMSDEVTATEQWSPYRELYEILESYLGGENTHLILPELKVVLRRHKQNFLALLQNPPKNAKSRKELQKGMVDGITVRGVGHQVLSKELYQETIIISDMYDMNEFVALDLLCSAQLQMAYYPGLPRGLVAILLYYDARRLLVASLRLLVQARQGILWSLKIKSDIAKFITDYTNELLRNGLFTKIFGLLKSLDLSAEIDKLQKNAALGRPKHRRQVIDLFKEIRSTLAEIVFMWSAQSGLPKEQTLSLISYLRETTIEEEGSGKLDNVNLFLIMALLYAFDLGILQSREDGEEIVQQLPILSEPNFIQSLLAELSPSDNKWKCEELHSVALFGFGVCLASLRLVPQNQQMHSAIEQEDQFVDTALEMKVFQFLMNVILENDLVYAEEFLLKRVHYLITDFIIHMYSKVKDLRMRADDTARTVQVYSNEGLEPPSNLSRDFEQLMLLIAKVYEKDPLNLQLVLDYWSPLEIKANQSHLYHAPPRAVSLFKFLRLAGDILPGSLFVPYLRMLSSLASNPQSARFCFNMLKQVTPGFSNNITWDHFFLSFNRYYTSLHQEPQLATMYRRQNIYHKGITPLEIEGLQAVLSVIRTVAKYDDFSRLALCEHPAWAPLNVFLGLVSCSLPIPLKADLLFTLATLSQSSEIAAQMWENLEASQVLVTVPSTSSFRPRGIQTELDEIESNMEEYPLTRAMLQLLDVLTDAGIPRTLGAGPRKPGFDPYLNFIIGSVFLKFNARSYKNQEEKWQVASLCLKLVEKFLNKYEPHGSDFPAQKKTNEFNSPPGFHLMLQLNSKSDLLNHILFIIDEGSILFDQCIPFIGSKLLEDCTLKCLNILDRNLILQPKFFYLLSSSSSPVLLTGMSKLLLSNNLRTGKPDYCLKIAKYVDFMPTLSSHIPIAIKILIHVTKSPVNHTQLTNILFASEEANAIRNSFVIGLDAGLHNHNALEQMVEMKEKMLLLMKQCLSYNSPNLTHFLLGFDVKKNISKMQFQLPGILSFTRTCLHSLFSILNTSCSIQSTLDAALLESAYQMLYLLTADSKTSEPVLRLLRLHPKFFEEHLNACFAKVNNGIPELNQLSWLLKTIAIELKITCQNNKVFYLKQLTNLLVDLPPGTKSSADIFELVEEMPALYEENGVNLFTRDRVKNLLTKLLLKFDFNVQELVAPRWEYFDTTVLGTILKSCETNDDPKLIDVKRLHHILIDELNTIQGTAAVGQRQAILEEIQKVMVHAVNVNNARKNTASIVMFVDSWRHVVEVLVTHIPLDTLSAKEQQIVDIQVLEGLLSKIININLLPEVANLLSGAALLLVVNLRKCHERDERQKKLLTNEEKQVSHSVVQINSSSLKEILNNLVKWVMFSDVIEQKLRTHLYGALASFLQLMSKDEGHIEDVVVDSSMYVSRLDSSKYQKRQGKSCVQIATDTLSLYGEKLIEMVAQDCISGHEVCRMLAMATINLFIEVTGAVNWISYLSGRGYLKHIIESILNSEEELRSLLEPSAENLKALYMYESKMAFLARVASTRVGAELLLEQKLLAYLSSMKVYDEHPEIKKISDEDEALPSYLPSVEHKYIRLWLPTFDICNAVLTSLGSDNQSAVSQILYFVVSHLAAIEIVLKAGSPTLPATSLKELSAVTSVIARTANNDLIGILDSSNESSNIRAILFRIERFMLALLPKFVLNNDLLKEVLKSTVPETNTYRTSKKLLLTLQIVSNLVLYSRNLIANHGVDHSGVGVIFQPLLKDSLHDYNAHSNYSSKTPSLGTVLEHLIGVVKHQLKEKRTYTFLTEKAKNIPEMNSIELKEFVKGIKDSHNVGLMRENTLVIVLGRITKKKQELEYCAFIIEHCLYIIWMHLDFYMLKAIPRARNFGLVNISRSINLDTTLASASEATWKVTTDDISELKRGLASILNDTFSKELQQTLEDCSDSDKGLIESLLRKIKRLIQFVPVK